MNLLRSARVWHYKVSSVLFFFFFVIAITGVLLGWKNLFGQKIYQSETKQKTVKSVADWLPLDLLQTLAGTAFKAKLPALTSARPDMVTARLDKGSVRFSFANQYNVQLNAATGELQSIDKKAPYWIIKLHDGELIDELLGLNGVSKRVYSTLMGLALFFLTLSGFWMVFKPFQPVKKSEKHQFVS